MIKMVAKCNRHRAFFYPPVSAGRAFYFITQAIGLVFNYSTYYIYIFDIPDIRIFPEIWSIKNLLGYGWILKYVG
jgi:hypothetical protein